MSFNIGDTIGPYRIVDQIGQGGMATVFKAYHPNLDRYVAFKVLHPAFTEDPNFLERFKREAQIVARLEHPAIIPIFDYADIGGQPYLVMKFVEGETLKARMKRQPLTLAETIRILEVVADALNYAHAQGILHRDIKPSNIMLDKNGTPYIADFGLARIAQAGESTLSQDMMLGTPQYISPEQAQGLRDLGPSTDIYSLGVVLYEIVVGRVPFNADTPYAIVHDHIYKPLPMPSRINPEVPPAVERVLLKALAKNPQDRYATATDMVAAFRQAVEEAGVRELSAARHRLSAPLPSSSAATVPPEIVSPPPAPVYTGIPSPVMVPTGSSASKQAYQRRANLWILGGIGSLLLICLTGLFIIVQAISDPDLRPWNTANTVGAEDEPEAAGLPPDVSLEEAQHMVEQAPDDPVGYMLLALAQMRNGDREAAITTVTQAIDQLQVPGDLLVATARRAADQGHDVLAAWLYLEILADSNVTLDLRDEAGQYLYEQTRSYPVLTLGIASQLLEGRSKTAPTYTVHALALLQFNRAYTRDQALDSINAALELNDSLAETYLVRAYYYNAIGQRENAKADLQRAISFPDTPGWVFNEADRLLHEE